MSKAKKKGKSRGKASPREFSEHEALGGMAFQAFLELWRADRDKCAPDPAAVNFLAGAFVKWMKLAGTQSLEEVLGVTADGRGRDTMMGEFNKTIRDSWYRHLMSLLVGAGFTVDEAAAAVADHQERYPEYLRKLHVSALQAPTVRDIFERLGGVKWAQANNYFGPDDEILEGSTTRGDERKSLIDKLSPHLIPHSIKG